MALLNRMDWYDLARATNWTPKYVPESDLFPPLMSCALDLPQNAWDKYDEPYKQTYPEYVKVQREKDAGAYSVRAALERSRIFENADPGWRSVMKAHYGAIARGEYAAASAEARMMRFSKAPGMRNMATLIHEFISIAATQVLHGEQACWVTARLANHPKFQSSAVASLDIDHRCTGVDGNTRAFICWSMFIRIGETDHPALPQFTFPIVDKDYWELHRLSVHVHNPSTDRARWIGGRCF